MKFLSHFDLGRYSTVPNKRGVQIVGVGGDLENLINGGSK